MNYSVLMLRVALVACWVAAGCVSTSQAPVVPVESTRAGAGRLIEPGDRLKVYVTSNKQFEGGVPLAVNFQGEIFLPTAGWVKVSGLGLDGAEDAVGRALQLETPEARRGVSVRFLDVIARGVLVTGAVRKPGPFQFGSAGRMTLLELLEQAGGPAETANIQEIRITRTLPTGERVNLLVNVEKILRGEEPDFELDRGDEVTVLRKII